MTQSNHEAFTMMPQENEPTEPTYETECIAPEGVGFGEGTISAKNRPEAPLSPEQLSKAIELLLAHWDEVLVDVEEDDDGCGDGRPTGRTLQFINGLKDKAREFKTSKLRAKIFGGGLQVAGSMWRAVTGKPENGETVLGDRKFVAGELKRRGIKYGAHIDNHAHGENCGCGALDKYALTTELSGKYRENILETAKVFYADEAEYEAAAPALNQAFDSRAAIAADEHYLSDAAGRRTMDFIEEDGAVIKELTDGHFEAIDILNEEPGKTIDQKKVAKLFEAAGLPDNIQVFVVDVWRGHMYADAVADMAAEQGYDRDAARQTAFADFIVNQLAVSAALTDGTQPVIRHRLALAA